MKVLGIVGSRRYLVEVDHSEIEKALGKYLGNLHELKVGDNLNLGEAYDYSAQISSVCKSMEDTMRSFSQAQATMHRFAQMVSQTDAQKQEGGDRG